MSADLKSHNHIYYHTTLWRQSNNVTNYVDHKGSENQLKRLIATK